jgi:hypothetical protein
MGQSLARADGYATGAVSLGADVVSLLERLDRKVGHRSS